MKIVSVICIVALATFLGSFIPMATAQGLVEPLNNLAALCTFLAVIGLVIERLQCDNEKDDIRENFLSTVCEKRFGVAESTCRRCLAIGNNRASCVADIGPDGVDDSAGDTDNDDCAFDDNLNTCLDEVERPM